jgi:hypothetical protein
MREKAPSEGLETEQAENETVSAPDREMISPRWSNLLFAITLASLLIYFSFQTLQLMVQRSELSAVKSSQESALQAAQKVEEQFKAVMTKLDELAKQGHAGAKMVLDSLQTASSGPPAKPGQ